MTTFRESLTIELKNKDFEREYEKLEPKYKKISAEIEKDIQREKELEYLKEKAKENIDENINKEELERALKLVGTYARKNNIKLTFSKGKKDARH